MSAVANFRPADVTFIRQSNSDIVIITDGVNKIEVCGTRLHSFCAAENRESKRLSGSDDCHLWPMNSYEELVRYADSFPYIQTFQMKNKEFVVLTLSFSSELHGKVVRDDAQGTYISVGRMKVRPR